MDVREQRRLFVTWRQPEGLIVPVGRLTQRVTGDRTHFVFVYLKAAETAAGFTGLPGLPDRYRVYESDDLFPVFANRVMSRQRADFGEYVEELGFVDVPEPFEVLARSEGVRATDRIEVIPDIERDGQKLSTFFFARGIRHLEGADLAVAELHVGDQLALREETDNPVNPRALLLDADDLRPVGWVPDLLLDVFHELHQLNGEWPTVCVDHVNPARTPAHMRLLCRMHAPLPSGYEPLSGPDFQPLVT